jgi:DNA-binding XRE family transcriptional regulator
LLSERLGGTVLRARQVSRRGGEILANYRIRSETRKISPALKGKSTHWVEPTPDVGIPLLLRKARTEKGLSQKEVAKKLKITYQTYQTWEKPKAANPTIRQLEKVAHAVGKKLVLEMV